MIDLCAGCAINCDHQKVVSMGITCIVNICLELNTSIDHENVHYIQIPVVDSPHINLSCYFQRIANLIQANAEAGGKTIVNCVVGVSRSASLCIAYFMTYYNQTFLEAKEWVRSQRFIINPNNAFVSQLEEYEKNLCNHIQAPKGKTLEEKRVTKNIQKITYILRTKRCKRIECTSEYQSVGY